MYVIDFKSNGTAEAMNSDSFSLSFLGRQKIERASDIRFNEELQAWQIWINTGNEYVNSEFTFSSYNDAGEFEVKWLNQSRLDGVQPMSHDGKNIAFALRLCDSLGMEYE